MENGEVREDRGEVGEKGGRFPFFPYTIFTFQLYFIILLFIYYSFLIKRNIINYYWVLIFGIVIIRISPLSLSHYTQIYL